jgi:branched-chain amino acid transport system substrate-binding protein
VLGWLGKARGPTRRPVLEEYMSKFRGAAAALAILLAPTVAPAQVSDEVVRIGVLTDLSGPYADFSGPGSVLATRMAIEDHGGKALGKPVEVVNGDHQNKPDVGGSLARRWIDTDRVDMIIDMPNSSVALAVQQVGRERNRIIINSSASTTELTGKQCSPVGFHWTSDSYALSSGTTRAVMQQGGKSWYYLTVDYEGGYALERGSEGVVKAEGGQVLGRARHPLNSSDFSSFLLQAQASKAQVVALANAGTDTINAIKQAGEFGLTKGGQRLVGMFVNVNDVKALGLQTAQGVVTVEAWYWDQSDETRAFAKRFAERNRGTVPSQYQAGIYSAVRHYLKAIEAAGTDEAMAVAAKMRALPVNDVFTKNGVVRADGRHVHDLYLVEVKKPAESKSDWDVYKVLATVPAAQAFKPLDAACPLVKQ